MDLAKVGIVRTVHNEEEANRLLQEEWVLLTVKISSEDYRTRGAHRTRYVTTYVLGKPRAKPKDRTAPGDDQREGGSSGRNAIPDARGNHIIE